MSTTWQAAADVRARVLDLVRLTPEQGQQLNGRRCARSSRTDDQLRPGGFAYTTGTGGHLAWPVRVCPGHMDTEGPQ
ncbi:hypothetical protein [Streptomyces sp. NPDC050535]|uniref:hypothetical protein n=1 Tax=Streptomyces sp. NPDC050535 TaxID=3365626 RepID=UPI00378EF601